MEIKPSAAIRNNYNEISMLCKETGGPVYLTENGEGDKSLAYWKSVCRSLGNSVLKPHLPIFRSSGVVSV